MVNFVSQLDWVIGYSERGVVCVCACACVCVCTRVRALNRAQLFVTPWTVAHQASLSTGFSRQEYWSGLPFSPPGNLPNPGIEDGSPTRQADSLSSEPPGKPTQIYGQTVCWVFL